MAELRQAEHCFVVSQVDIEKLLKNSRLQLKPIRYRRIWKKLDKLI